MIAIELISESIPPLKHTDTGEYAFQWMEEFRVRHLPVMKKDNFVGLISEDDILNQEDASKTLNEMFHHLPRPYLLGNAHIYEILAKLSNEHITVLPILDTDENYLGCISVIELMHKIADTSAIKEIGGILVLELNERDYSLSQIAQIVESENAKILSSYITSHPNSTKLEITLKINQIDLSRIIRSFERYDYSVKATFQRSNFQDDLKNRYDELMNYLNL